MILFRQTPPGYPFLWENLSQPEGRWHGPGEGPAHYCADTPDGAWAEFLRHQDIKDSIDLPGINRDLWAIEVADKEPFHHVRLSHTVCTAKDYRPCQAEAKHLRAAGATGVKAPSAALVPDVASGFVVEGGLKPAPRRNGSVYVLFGRRTDLIGWRAAAEAHPSPDLLSKVRYL